jgi:hypothetical protein
MGAPLVDAYEASLEDAPVGFWRDVWLMVRGTKKAKADNA